MERELNIFEDMLVSASEQVGAQYFHLPVADADAAYRERVYCYELYHQLRCRWEDFPFSLGGEIDKSGHPHFRGGPYASAKPDFLVHIPGNMDRNLTCVEVKPIIRPVGEFTSDLQKLTWFCHNADYYRGIFLVYGADPSGRNRNELLHANLQAAVEHGEDIDRAVIHAFYHPDVGVPAQRIDL